MGTTRLETFSDGVMAIIITIMVLEMKVPRGDDSLVPLKPLLPIFISYILSFIYVAIYWNNHHHLLFAAKQINGKTLWANTHLLFWLSLIPFVSSWMGQNDFTKWTVALYGFVLFMCAVAYYILAQTMARHHGEGSTLHKAINKDTKGKISLVIYAIGIGLSFVNPWLGFSMYALVAAMWFMPDRRIERQLNIASTEEEKVN